MGNYYDALYNCSQKKKKILKPVEGVTDLINTHTVSPEKKIFL